MILGTALPTVYLLRVRPWLLHWGATHAELRTSLPSDELVPQPGLASTRAVTIHAPVAQVWPWLAQIGQDRAGFYSYDWLENLAGCQLHNADRIHPEWQQRIAGKLVRLHPATGLSVTRFEPNRALVLGSSWGFVLEPIDGQSTRLLARSRTPRGWGALAYALLIELPHFIMERKMLLGIKQRAEQAAKSGASQPPV